MSADVQPSSVLRPRVDVRVRRTRDGYLVALPDAEAFALPETSSFIWRALDGRRTVAEVARLLAEEYGVEPDEALTDTLDMVGTLAGMGMLRDLTRATQPRSEAP